MVGRRAELTFRGNLDAGRHAWLRLTPAYSVQVVHDLLATVDAQRVLDPFCGTGTTPLCATARGCDAVALDVNPFLVWFATTKLRRFRSSTLNSMGDTAAALVKNLNREKPIAAPPIHNIERWWAPATLDFLCRLKPAIDRHRGRAERALLQIAFCRTMMAASGAAFNHPSMSFRAPAEHDHEALRVRFLEDARLVQETARKQPSGNGEIRSGDSRDLKALGRDRFDAVVTSPPYPNRMSYVRELRPYMYWTGYLREAREAGDLDWDAIGGTWGVATSRLKQYERRSGRRPRGLASLMKRVRNANPKNGPVLASYLDRYFEDIELHLKALHRHVRPHGSVHYVIGNASFYGELVPAEDYFSELMTRAGFRNPQVQILRKRNSNKKLFEFVVSATRGGR